MGNSAMKVSDALADSVEAEGVHAIFGLMGDGNIFFLARLLERGKTRVYDARHEGSAVAMADGYARATGDVGVATVTHGPGVTQLGTSLTVASRHGSPLVVITGDIPAMVKGMGSHRQDTDHRAFALASGAQFHQLRSPSTVAADVRHAFSLARTQRMPVLLNCPTDIQEREFVGEFRYTPRAPKQDRSRLTPDPIDIETAADMMASARHPVLIAGAGAVAADAGSLIEAVGDRIGAAYATTLRAKGYLDGPWSVGICGDFSNAAAEALLAAADLVVLIGASGSLDTAIALPLAARTMEINTDPLVTIGGRTPDHLVHADATSALEAILRRLTEADYSAPGFRGGSYTDLFSVDPVAADLEQAEWDIPVGTVDPRQVVRLLDKLLPEKCTIVIGAGHFFSFPAMFLSGRRTRRFLFTYDFGCIGQAIPTAFGVAVATPEHPTIVFEGDASAMMSIQELDTTARYQPRMLVFIMNDGVLGAEYHKLRSSHIDPKWSQVRPPHFGKVAEAFGNAGGIIAELADVEREVMAFGSGSGPRYVDVRTPPMVMSAPFGRRFPSLARGVARAGGPNLPVAP
jgi:acetolactate synthase-1/2/3 large subunit